MFDKYAIISEKNNNSVQMILTNSMVFDLKS